MSDTDTAVTVRTTLPTMRPLSYGMLRDMACVSMMGCGTQTRIPTNSEETP